MAGRPAEPPPQPKAPSRRSQKQRTADNRRWKSGASLVCEITGCVFCAERRSHLTQHHVVYVQRLRTLKADAWDPRNRMTICNDAHMAHHRRSKVIQVAELPDLAFEFAREIMGAGAAHEYLSRRYAGTDPRLDALDAEWRLAGDTAAH